MKILYIAPFYDETGYSRAALDYVLSMDLVGIDVIPRPIKLNNVVGKVPDRYKILESKSEFGCKICIQHCLPSMFEQDGRFGKNIGLFAWETDSFHWRSNWAEKCNLMDEIWVINNNQKETCINSGVRVPIQVVPHAVDINKFNQFYPKLDCMQEFHLNESFIFYTIGEFTRRKNFVALLKAFYLEFDPLENVQLVIKTNQNLDDFNNKIIAGLKLYSDMKYYKRPLILDKRMTEEEICSLHYNSDCYISTSYGEAWCEPAMDAIGFGKIPIVPNNTGFVDYMSKKAGWLVDCHKEPVFGMMDSVPGLYSGKENWYSVDINSARKSMRQVFDIDSTTYGAKTKECDEIIQRFSYSNIGSKIKQVLGV